MNKTAKKWKYKVVDNRNNEFIMQTTIEPRDFPVTLKIGKQYIIPIMMNKSGKVGNVDGQYMELIEDYEEGITSTIPSEEQGGTKEQVDIITANDGSFMVTNPVGGEVTGQGDIYDRMDSVETIPKPETDAMEKMETSKQRFLKKTANDKPVSGAHPNKVLTKEGSQLVVKNELSVETIIKYLNPKATEQQAFMFLQLCQNQGLDPFVGDAYLVTYGDKSNMIVSKDAFLKKAEEQGDYEGFTAGILFKVADEIDCKEGSFLDKPKEILVGGWAKVFRKGLKTFYAEVALYEYFAGGKQYPNLWDSKPATMIRKVALVQALREAFPASFQGMYDRAEIDTNE